MFTPEDRESITAGLVEAARADPDVIAAAIVGSGARGTLDRWSDIDLALRLAPEADEPTVVERWTERIRERHGLADALDVMAEARYRVFLLPSSLQIDLSFWPADRFRATEAGFRLVFGEAGSPTTEALPDRARAIGTGWLFALHARSAIQRGRNRQAVLMLDGLRDQVVALGCLRHGLNPWHGRGVDGLPPVELAALDRARAADADTAELTRSLRAFLELLLAEADAHDPARADRLRPVFRELSG